MKKFLLPLILVLSLTGCVSPFSLWKKTEKKVDVAQEKLQANQDKTVDAAKSYTYATKLSLDLNDAPNKYTLLAQDFNSKTLLTLGSPSIEEVNGLKLMVTSLLSTNAEIVAEGNRKLNQLDKKVSYLQNEKGVLEGKLDAAEKKLTEVGEYNSGLAQKWHSLTKWFWYFVWGIGIFFVLKVLTQVLPPPYNVISGVLAMPISLIIKGIHAIFPDVKKYAGVVAVKTYDETKKALETVVVSIEDAKSKINAKNEPTNKKSEGLEQLKTELKTNTDTATKVVINRTKEQLGYV